MRFTQKLGFAIGLAALAAIVVAPMAMAGVVNSNHDMAFKFPTNPKAGACSHCHIPHKAGGAKLWAVVPGTGTGWQAETITNLCYSCHGSTTYAGAMQVNPFQASQHGRNQTLLTTGINTGQSDPTEINSMPTELTGTYLGSDGSMKCTSCHDVHNNDHRPFIRFNTAAGGAYNFQAVCQYCHQRRIGTGKGTANIQNSYSQHPTDQTIANAPRAAFVGVASEFNISPGAVGAGVSGYNTGGHRNDGTATAASLMTCATCHAVHGNEVATYSSTNDGTTTVQSAITAFPSLAVRNTNPVGAAPAPICVGCHTNVMANKVGYGPGSQNTYSHPYSTSRPTWLIPNPPALAQGYKWGVSAAEDVIVCQTCHDIHYAKPNTSLLFGQIETPTATSNRNCVQCHAFFAAMNHHPAGTGVLLPTTGGAAMTPPINRASAGVSNWVNMAYARAGGAYTFYTGGGANAVMCYTCHNQTGAHNNSGIFNATPIQTGSEVCMDCHSSNPSYYTTVAGAGTGSATITVDASHYLGTIFSTGYKKTTAWGTTNLSSSWGTVAGNGVMICQSCHTFKLGGLLAGGTTSNNAVLANVQRTGIRTLLEHSGNLDTSTTDNLCIGCHGGTPSGGNSGTGQTGTHPTISAGWTTAATAAIVSKINGAGGSVTLAAGSIMTCESCHRPHDAAQGSGALILEVCGTTSNKTAGFGAATGFQRATSNTGQNGNYVEEATFCNACHNY